MCVLLYAIIVIRKRKPNFNIKVKILKNSKKILTQMYMINNK